LEKSLTPPNKKNFQGSTNPKEARCNAPEERYLRNQRGSAVRRNIYFLGNGNNRRGTCTGNSSNLGEDVLEKGLSGNKPGKLLRGDSPSIGEKF